MIEATDPCDPVAAYLATVRSVLFIDDRFPVYGSDPREDDETDRARALWTECTRRGWICDVDNAQEWDSPEMQARLTACDLLVLDYHLLGDDPRPALRIVSQLAKRPDPILVVVYTADPDLDRVLLMTALAARGATPDRDLLAEQDVQHDWSFKEMLSHIRNDGHWMRSFVPSYKAAASVNGKPFEVGSALLEQKYVDDFAAEELDAIRPIERVTCDEDNRWFLSGNLFLLVLGKRDVEREKEAGQVIAALQAAITDWQPTWLTCLIASSRRTVEMGSFRDDLLPMDSSLENGLLHYIAAGDEQAERDHRASVIASRLLVSRFEAARTFMMGPLVDRSGEATREGGTETLEEGLELNAFLSTLPFDHHHVQMGTIFRMDPMEDEYWICVTPACDMVPRPASGPWTRALDPHRPMLALRAEIVGDLREPTEQAERGRHVFFWDTARKTSRPVACACFHTETHDVRPQIEAMIIGNQGRVEDNTFDVFRTRNSGEADSPIEVRQSKAVPVAQLRSPYAERLTQMVGAHQARIGVDFKAVSERDDAGDPPARRA